MEMRFSKFGFLKYEKGQRIACRYRASQSSALGRPVYGWREIGKGWGKVEGKKGWFLTITKRMVFNNL